MNYQVQERPEREVAEMIRRFRQGESHGKIAKDFGITRQRVHQILRKRGVTRKGMQEERDRVLATAHT